MPDAMKDLADAIDRVAHEIATATLADCTPESPHEAIVAGFKAGAAYILARLMQAKNRERGN